MPVSSLCNLFHTAECFNKFGPVGSTQKPKGTNTITDRNLIGCLFLIFKRDQISNTHFASGKLLFKPAQAEAKALLPLPCNFRTKPATKDADKTGFDRAMSAAVRIRSPGEIFQGFHHGISPVFSKVLINHIKRNKHCHTTQIFNNRKP
jgi:hypothetical protein